MEREDCSVIYWDEAFEERAAIMQYMGGMTREQAEDKAAKTSHGKGWRNENALSRKRPCSIPRSDRDEGQQHERRHGPVIPLRRVRTKQGNQRPQENGGRLALR